MKARFMRVFLIIGPKPYAIGHMLYAYGDRCGTRCAKSPDFEQTWPNLQMSQKALGKRQ